MHIKIQIYQDGWIEDKNIQSDYIDMDREIDINTYLYRQIDR